jgi:arylsulfatase A-like enzyme
MIRRQGVLITSLHLSTLFGFALAQPLFDLLSRNAEFLVARRVEPVDLVALAIVLCVVAPLCVLFVECGVSFASSRAQRAVHLAAVAALVAATILPALKHFSGVPGSVLVSAAAVLGAVAAASYARFQLVRLFIMTLSPAPAIFLGLFLFRPPVINLLLTSSVVRTRPITVGIPAPVVLVVFDEFSGISLLDERHEIDAVRYPNFAALAKDATWFRNATTVSTRSEVAVPALLTGRLPDRSRLPTADEYPDNLFTLLAGTYDFRVFETLTHLCPTQLGGERTRAAGLRQRLGGLLGDLAIIYLHILLPSDLAAELPSVTEKWRDFAVSTHPPAQIVPTARQIMKQQDLFASGSNRPQHFADFLTAIQPTARPTLYLTHVLLPHVEWRYLPSGTDYGSRDLPGLDRTGVWGSNDWLVTQGFQRYLLQVGYVDTLLGQLLRHLQAAGLYERSLIVITADHGVSSIANEKRRGLGGVGYPEVLLVPLLIKAPQQHTGTASDRNVEIIDVLPTIADILHIHIPWSVDGQSAFAASQPERAQKIFMTVGDHTERLVFDASLDAKERNLARQLELFGSGATRPNGLFRIGPHNELIGQLAPRNLDGDPRFAVSLDDVPLFAAVHPDSGFVPAQITGAVTQNNGSKPLPLAISINGRISAVTWTYSAREMTRFSAMVPESSFQAGQNTVEVFVISDVNGEPRLTRPIGHS